MGLGYFYFRTVKFILGFEAEGIKQRNELFISESHSQFFFLYTSQLHIHVRILMIRFETGLFQALLPS